MRRKSYRRNIPTLPAEVIYDPEAAAVYIQFRKRVHYIQVIKKLPQEARSDILLIVVDYERDHGLSGIEILLNPRSKLKLLLDNELRKLIEKGG